MKMLGRSGQTRLRKEKIIHTALECFTEFGYSNTTMAMIRKKAGASTGSIYHHFKNKEQLAGAVYLEGIRDYQQGYIKHLCGRKKAKAGINSLVKYHLGWVEGNTMWARYLNRMRHAEFMGPNEEEFRALNNEFISVISQWVLDHIKTGEIRKLAPGIFGAVVMGPLQEYTRMWLEGWVKIAPTKAAAELSKAIWSNLKAETERRG